MLAGLQNAQIGVLTELPKNTVWRRIGELEWIRGDFLIEERVNDAQEQAHSWITVDKSYGQPLLQS